MQKITPFLWFDTQAEEAMNFYVSIFKNSKVGAIRRYGLKSSTVMKAMLQMRKIELGNLKQAYEHE